MAKITVVKSVRRVIYHPEELPGWVEAHSHEVNKKKNTATVVVWGFEFKDKPIHEDPSDRGKPPYDYVIVKHPSGNWLKAYW